MAEALTIEGKTYMPLALAGQHFGYTREYLHMLLKQGKFDARKVGTRWYVDLESARAHFAEAKESTQQKREQLRTERKHEYVRHTKKHAPHHIALTETLAMLVIGLALGVTGYVGTTPPQTATVAQSDNPSFFHTLARSVYTLVTGQPAQTLTGTIDDPTTTTEPSSLIVAPADSFTDSDAQSIRDSFSDPVTITRDLENPDTGIITPVFREGKRGEEYRYLMVPVTTN